MIQDTSDKTTYRQGDHAIERKCTRDHRKMTESVHEEHDQPHYC